MSYFNIVLRMIILDIIFPFFITISFLIKSLFENPFYSCRKALPLILRIGNQHCMYL